MDQSMMLHIWLVLAPMFYLWEIVGGGGGRWRVWEHLTKKLIYAVYGSHALTELCSRQKKDDKNIALNAFVTILFSNSIFFTFYASI